MKNYNYRFNYTSKDIVAYLRKLEWSMGNGQCPECCGLIPGWGDKDKTGHKLTCELAACLQAYSQPLAWIENENE